MVKGIRAGLGLRGRIVGALLITSVATLAVAAIALLGPLDHQLRNAAQNTLASDLHQRSVAQAFRKLDLRYVHLGVTPSNPSGSRVRGPGFDERLALTRKEQSLTRALGANVVLFGDFDRFGAGHAVPTLEAASDDKDFTPDVRRAYLTGHQIKSFGTDDGGPTARVALSVVIQGVRYVLQARRPITQIHGATHVVQVAVVEAAIAGLILTLLLGIPLSGRLVRRLRNLRQAAVRMAQEGIAADVPVDRTRDEVGDLGRSLVVMQRRLHTQEEARRSFVSTASHELRTPLASLEGMLELLAEELGDPAFDPDDARELLERARAQSYRLSHLAGDLLDLSRIDAQVPLRSEAIELHELARAVMAEFDRAATERDVQLALLHSEGSLWALGDPGSVARIIRILIDNALRVSPAGSSVQVIIAGDDPASVSLSVADEGPGVEADERELIFERFHRGRQTGGQAGFGLGLAIGRELAARMHGTLTLSPTQARGARFDLSLPRAGSAAVELDSAEPETAAVSGPVGS